MNDIKVGSEWVLKAKDDRRCKILYVGKEALFAEWGEGVEDIYKISDFLGYYKPAPVRRTVWLNVYPNRVHAHSKKILADAHKMPDLLFQQEVELIDPREGGTKP